MPSGTLCRVMAVISRVFCRQAPSPPRRRRGSRLSSAARNTTPASIPPAAGSQPGNGPSAARSMAGSSRLHTEAAVITPAAKPSMARWDRGRGAPGRKNTTAAPRVVIRQVKPVPRAAQPSACSIRIHAFHLDSGGTPPVCQYIHKARRGAFPLAFRFRPWYVVYSGIQLKRLI